MGNQDESGRRSFLAAAGVVVGGALLSGRAEARGEEGGIVIERSPLKKQKDGSWGLAYDCHLDTSISFRVGETEVQWTYGARHRLSVTTEDGRAPGQGAHRLVLVHFLATGRVALQEPEGGVIHRRWDLDPLSLAVVVEYRDGQMHVHPPAGPAHSDAHGLDVSLSHEVVSTSVSQALLFETSRVDFSRFDREGAVEGLARENGVERKKVFDANPVGTRNNLVSPLEFRLSPA